MNHADDPGDRRSALRTGAVSIVVGSLAFGGFRIAHGDLPADDAPAALAFIHHHPLYESIHLGTILGVLALIGGFVALSSTLDQPRTRLLGQWATASALVGAAIFIVDFTIDGVAGHDLATRWADAAPADQANLVHAAQTAFTILRGTSLTSLIVLLGLPLALFGLALIRQDYPAWLGYGGIVLGAATTIAAGLLLFQPTLFDGVLLYGLLASIAVPLWGLALGAIMWRRAAATT
jgi:hypothetical protein